MSLIIERNLMQIMLAYWNFKYLFSKSYIKLKFFDNNKRFMKFYSW